MRLLLALFALALGACTFDSSGTPMADDGADAAVFADDPVPTVDAGVDPEPTTPDARPEEEEDDDEGGPGHGGGGGSGSGGPGPG